MISVCSFPQSRFRLRHLVAIISCELCLFLGPILTERLSCDNLYSLNSCRNKCFKQKGMTCKKLNVKRLTCKFLACLFRSSSTLIGLFNKTFCLLPQKNVGFISSVCMNYKAKYVHKTITLQFNQLKGSICNTINNSWSQ